MTAISPDQRTLLEALAKAQTAVPKGGHKEFLTASTLGGITVVLADGSTNLPLDTTDLDQLVEAGYVKVTQYRDHGDVNGVVTAKGLAFLASESEGAVRSATSGSGGATGRAPRTPRVFYSWQSDISPGAACRTLIGDALELSVEKIAGDDSIDIEPVIDRDTQNVPGAPDIGLTILSKIETAAAFVADVTIVGKTDSGKPTPNPNVLIELGYALHALGPSRVVLVQNTAFGGPELLPFDLRQKRVLGFNSPSDASERATERRVLAGKLESALRDLFKNHNLRHPALSLALSSRVTSVDRGVHHCDLIASVANTGTKRFDDWEVEVDFPTPLMEPHTVVAIRVDRQSDADYSLFRAGHHHFGVPLRVGEERSVTLGFRADHAMLEQRRELRSQHARMRVFIDGELAATLDRTVEELLPPALQSPAMT